MYDYQYSNYGRLKRLEYRLSGKQLATLFNISQLQISRYERGKPNFTIEMILRILVALKLNEMEIELFFYKLLSDNYFHQRFEY